MPGPARRKRQRQEFARPRPAAACSAAACTGRVVFDGEDLLTASRRGACVACATHRRGVPGSVRLARPAHARRRHRRRAAAHPRRSATPAARRDSRAGAAGRGRPGRRPAAIAIRTSSPAASASASRSPARWPADPDLLVCDEAVSALDAHHRAEILALLARLKRDRGLALLFITHDFSAARALAERIAVMDQGRLVEQGTADRCSSPAGAPRHPGHACWKSARAACRYLLPEFVEQSAMATKLKRQFAQESESFVHCPAGRAGHRHAGGRRHQAT